MPTLLLTLFLLFLPARAQTLDTRPIHAEQFNILNENRSLATLKAAAQDPEGYVWLATINGLFVYDGNQIRPALEDALHGTHITSLHIARDRVVWVGTNSGVLEFSLLTGQPRWHHKPFMRPHENILRIYEDHRGHIWVGTLNGGLFRYDPISSRFEKIPFLPASTSKHTSLLDFCDGPDRNLWIATNKGLFRLNGDSGPGTFISRDIADPHKGCPTKRKLAGALTTTPKNCARNLVADGSGGIWVGFSEQGLWRYSPQHQALFPVKEIPSLNIKGLYTDTAGDVWIGTNEGLFKFDCRHRKFSFHPLLLKEFTQPQAVSMVSISETTPGDLWLGTNRLGILRCTPHPASRIIPLTFPPDETKRPTPKFIMHSTKDACLYVGTQKGQLFRSAPLAPGEFNPATPVSLSSYEDIHSSLSSMVSDKEGGLLLGSVNTLIALKNGNAPDITHINPKLEYFDQAFEIADIKIMPDGRIWFVNMQQLFSWKQNEKAPRPEYAFPRTVPKLTVQGETLWLETSRAVHAINTLTRAVRELPLPQEVLENNKITALHVDSAGSMWIAGMNRLYQYTPDSRVLTAITSGDQHLPIPSVQSFWADEQGNLWMQTSRAIYLLRKGALEAELVATPGENQSLTFTSSPIWVDGTGLVYGHSQGLMVLDTAQILAPSRTQALVSDMRIFGRPVPALSSGRLPATLELDHTQNFLSFTFASPEGSDHNLHEPKFRYRLLGVAPAWNEAGQTKTVSYAHLEPGEYEFQVAEQSSMDTPARIRFTIHPPVWLTLWAKGAYLISGVLLLFAGAFLYSRFERDRLRKHMLETLVMLDPLTGIPNRRKFREVLQSEKSRCTRGHHRIAVIMVDIDYFKGYNDRFGHQAGDEALCRVAKILATSLGRPDDFVARYGGEEFVIILPSTDRPGAERVAEKIRCAVQQAAIPYPGSPEGELLTVSMGISVFSPQSELHIDSGLFTADQALYQAKRQGRNCVFFKDHCLSLTPTQ